MNREELDEEARAEPRMLIQPLDNVGSPNNYILQDETYLIIGAAYEVYYKLGTGFSEPVYQEALEIEFGLRGIAFQPQKQLLLNYKGNVLKKGYRVDFLCSAK